MSEKLAKFRWSPTLAVGLVLVMTLVAGALQGKLSNRWGPSPDMQAAAARMSNLPDRFGDWQLHSVEPFDPKVEEILQCAGHFHHKYVNTKNPLEIVSVAVIVGPSGPTAVHTPEICYSSRAYKTLVAPQHVTIAGSDGREHEFWAMTFQGNDLAATTLRTYYAWSTGDTWSAPNSARFAFAGQPMLYKIQLAGNTPSGFNSTTDDTCRRFLEAFLPVANAVLFDDTTK